MKWFYNMKIGAKLLLGFIIVSLLTGVIGVVGIWNIKSLSDSDSKLYSNMTVPISQLSGISTAFQRMRVNARDMIIASSDSDIQQNIDKINERIAEIDELSSEYEALILSDRMREEFNKFVDSRKAYRTEIDKVIKLAKENKDAEAYEILGETGSAGIASRAEQDAIEKLVELKVEDAKQQEEKILIKPIAQC